jgi:hypothetical protein
MEEEDGKDTTEMAADFLIGPQWSLPKEACGGDVIADRSDLVFIGSEELQGTNAGLCRQQDRGGGAVTIAQLGEQQGLAGAAQWHGPQLVKGAGDLPSKGGNAVGAEPMHRQDVETQEHEFGVVAGRVKLARLGLATKQVFHPCGQVAKLG